MSIYLFPLARPKAQSFPSGWSTFGPARGKSVHRQSFHTLVSSQMCLKPRKESVSQKIASVIVTFHQVEFPQGWVILSVNKWAGERAHLFLGVPSPSCSKSSISEVGVSLCAYQVHIHNLNTLGSQALAVWLQMPLCCDLKLLASNSLGYLPLISLLSAATAVGRGRQACREARPPGMWVVHVTIS